MRARVRPCSRFMTVSPLENRYHDAPAIMAADSATLPGTSCVETWRCQGGAAAAAGGWAKHKRRPPGSCFTCSGTRGLAQPRPLPRGQSRQLTALQALARLSVRCLRESRSASVAQCKRCKPSRHGVCRQ